jgi:hypothetical protein
VSAASANYFKDFAAVLAKNFRTLGKKFVIFSKTMGFTVFCNDR